MTNSAALKTIVLLGLTVLFTSGCRYKVLAGTDYLKTVSGASVPTRTSFDLTLPTGTLPDVKFVGNPRAGNAYDTAITRLDEVSLKPGGSGTTRLKLTELSLKSETSVPINGQQYNLLVSLDPNKPSTGTMNIILDAKTKSSGTFTSNFDQVNFVVSFDPVGGGPKIPDMSLSDKLFNDGKNEFGPNQWISGGNKANPPCTTVSPKPRGATDTNSHTGTQSRDLDIFPNGQINENHKNTSRWHRAACI
jgi:hypothetical protein